ncbi:hypothetical protein AgCh_008242 [Apium graveolens]
MSNPPLFGAPLLSLAVPISFRPDIDFLQRSRYQVDGTEPGKLEGQYFVSVLQYYQQKATRLRRDITKIQQDNRTTGQQTELLFAEVEYMQKRVT